MINIADPAELDALDPAICDGIGLVRTEFLFGGGGAAGRGAAVSPSTGASPNGPAGKPVTIRTLDAGGDKPIPGLTDERRDAIRSSACAASACRWRIPRSFRMQLRALARAAAYGRVKIMLPMVTVPEELAATRALLDEAVAALDGEGLPHARAAARHHGRGAGGRHRRSTASTPTSSRSARTT